MSKPKKLERKAESLRKAARAAEHRGDMAVAAELHARSARAFADAATAIGRRSMCAAAVAAGLAVLSLVVNVLS